MNVSIRLHDSTMEKINLLSGRAHLTKIQYIREAIDYYNKLKYAELLRERMIEASHKIRKESSHIHQEFGETESEL